MFENAWLSRRFLLMKRVAHIFGCIICTVLIISGCSEESPDSRLEQNSLTELEKGAQAFAECRETQCTELSLSFASLEDYSVLNELTHVTSLTLQYNTFESLSDISDMAQLEDLRIVATRIRSVSAFADFPNLTVLHIQSALAEDVRPTLSRMPQLSGVAINLPEDGDISFVRSLPNLETLELLGGPASDLSPLVGHPSLKNLQMSLSLPGDVSALLDIPNLQTFTIGDVIERFDSSGVLDRMRVNGVSVTLTKSSAVH